MTADSKALWNNLTLKFDNKQEETGGSGFPLETYMAFGMCIIINFSDKSNSTAELTKLVISNVVSLDFENFSIVARISSKHLELYRK